MKDRHGMTGQQVASANDNKALVAVVSAAIDVRTIVALGTHIVPVVACSYVASCCTIVPSCT